HVGEQDRHQDRIDDLHHAADRAGDLTMDSTISTDLPLLIELLVARRLLDSKGVETAFREQAKRGCTLEEALLHARLVTEVNIARAYSEQLLLPLVVTADAIDV